MITASQLDIFEALAQRESSMALVTAAADNSYRRELEDAIERLANGGDPFCADDIRAIAGDPPAHCSPNLVGAVVNAALRQRVVEAIGFTRSSRVIGHGNRLLLLRGLLP